MVISSSFGRHEVISSKSNVRNYSEEKTRKKMHGRRSEEKWTKETLFFETWVSVMSV